MQGKLFYIPARTGIFLYAAVIILHVSCTSVGLDNSRIKSLDIEARKYCDEGKRLSGQNQFAEAIKAYTMSIKIDPSVAAYTGRSAEFSSKGRYDDALTDMNSALLLSPRHAPSYLNRGNIYFKKEDYNRSIKDYSRAISLDPKRADFYFNQALAYARLGRIDDARDMYEKSAAADPHYYPALYNLACIYAEKKDYRNAMDRLEKAVREGFKDAVRMKAEAAFAPIRNSARFRALLNRIQIKK